MQAALSNAGLALGHEVLANDLLNDGRLVRPYEEAVEMEETYYLIEPPETREDPRRRPCLPNGSSTKWERDQVVKARPVTQAHP